MNTDSTFGDICIESIENPNFDDFHFNKIKNESYKKCKSVLMKTMNCIDCDKNNHGVHLGDH